MGVHLMDAGVKRVRVNGCIIVCGAPVKADKFAEYVTSANHGPVLNGPVNRLLTSGYGGK